MGVDSMVVRRPSHGFGWVDRRMVSEGYLVRLNQAEVVVYLVLCVLADRHGISYYGLESLARLVKIPSERVRGAIERLVQQEFIAVEGQFIQVLDLDGRNRPKMESVPQQVSAPLEREVENEPPEREAGKVLGALPEDLREYLLEMAQKRLQPLMGGKPPSTAALEATALCLWQEEQKQ